MTRIQILKKYLRSILLIAIFECLMVGAAIYLIFFAYDSMPESGYWIKRRLGGILIGVIAIYISLPCMIAAIKNLIFIMLDLHHCEDITTRIHINKGMPIRLPWHPFHIVGNQTTISKISIPFDVYWMFAFTRSYYLIDANLLNQKRKNHSIIGTEIIATKYAHIVLFIES